MSGRDVYITWGGGEVFLRGNRPGMTGLFVEGDGIEGWDSSPEPKVSLTERQTGDGAHAIEEPMVLYAARTVIIPFHAHGRDRDETMGFIRSLNAACHRLVTLRIVDSAHDTWTEGYVRTGVEPKWNRYWATGEIEIVCPDPRRYSTEVHRAQLMPTGSLSGGLHYGTGAGLVYDLTYGDAPEVMQNIATLENAGNSTAYPVVMVNGEMQGNFRIDSEKGSLLYTQSVGSVPLELDSLTRTANVAGLDTSRHLASRGFPEIPPGGSTTLNFQAYGNGWADIEWHDTWI